MALKRLRWISAMIVAALQLGGATTIREESGTVRSAERQTTGSPAIHDHWSTSIYSENPVFAATLQDSEKVDLLPSPSPLLAQQCDVYSENPVHAASLRPAAERAESPTPPASTRTFEHPQATSATYSENPVFEASLQRTRD